MTPDKIRCVSTQSQSLQVYSRIDVSRLLVIDAEHAQAFGLPPNGVEGALRRKDHGNAILYK
ncbi:MAG TPA: hypothetical protein VFO72_02570, partial [Pyrinomonadaceae bacterium]|nr:hypothetical protein [Pyrinomonadaceae bacterium]